MKSTLYVDSKKFEAALLHSGKSKQQVMSDSGYGKQTINNLLRENYCRKNPFAMRTILAVSASVGCAAADLLVDSNGPEPKPQEPRSWVGYNIDRLLKEKGMTLNGLARACGLDENNIRRIKNGYNLHPRRSTIAIIASGLGVFAADLLKEPELECKLFDEPVDEVKQAADANARVDVLAAIREVADGLIKLHAALMAALQEEGKS